MAALSAAFTIPPLAVVAGHVALSQIKKTGDQGRGLAIAGLVIGYVFMAFIVVMTILVIWLGIFVLWLMGLIAAASGEMKPVPVLGAKYQEWFGKAFE